MSNYVIAGRPASGNSVIIYTIACAGLVETIAHRSRDIQRGKDMGSLTPMGQSGSNSHWIKSSLSFSNGNCVEVASLPDDAIGVRDSKDSEGPVLRFTPDEWHAFIGGVRNGEFDGFGKS